MRTTDAPTDTILIGPGLDPTPRPSRREVEQDACCSVEPQPWSEASRAEADRAEADEASRAARRVVIALMLGVLLVPLLLWGMVALNAEVTPATAMILMALVAAGAVGGAAASDRASGKAKAQTPRQDEGRPVGCCPGPRPLRAFRK